MNKKEFAAFAARVGLAQQNSKEATGTLVGHPLLVRHMGEETLALQVALSPQAVQGVKTALAGKAAALGLAFPYVKEGQGLVATLTLQEAGNYEACSLKGAILKPPTPRQAPAEERYTVATTALAQVLEKYKQ